MAERETRTELNRQIAERGNANVGAVGRQTRTEDPEANDGDAEREAETDAEAVQADAKAAQADAERAAGSVFTQPAQPAYKPGASVFANAADQAKKPGGT